MCVCVCTIVLNIYNSKTQTITYTPVKIMPQLCLCATGNLMAML